MTRKAAKLDPATAGAAQSIIASALGVPVSSVASDGRTGCEFADAGLPGACSQRFLPHGIGPVWHTGCPYGMAVQRAALAARKAGEDDKAAARKTADLILAAAS